MVKPYFYVSGSKSAAGTKHRTSAASIIQAAVKARRSRPKASSKSVQKLSRSVAKLKVGLNGQVQMSRQVCDWASVPPAGIHQANSVTDIRPFCFLHQAISVDSAVFSLSPQGTPPTNTLDTYTSGVWSKQPFPLTQPVGDGGDGLPASYNKFDQLQYWDQADGVQNKYYHSSTEYTLNCLGIACTGYIDVFLVHPKRSFQPSAQQDISLPLGLQGFTHLSLGDNIQYAINPQYFSCKRLKRKYFNTTAPAGTTPEERELQTNPNFDVKFRIVNAKSRRLIRAPEQRQGAILDSTDIPFRKQDWIVVSSTIKNRDSSTDNYIQVKGMYRTVHWRDYYGAST